MQLGRRVGMLLVYFDGKALVLSWRGRHISIDFLLLHILYCSLPVLLFRVLDLKTLVLLRRL